MAHIRLGNLAELSFASQELKDLEHLFEAGFKKLLDCNEPSVEPVISLLRFYRENNQRAIARLINLANQINKDLE